MLVILNAHLKLSLILVGKKLKGVIKNEISI